MLQSVYLRSPWREFSQVVLEFKAAVKSEENIEVSLGQFNLNKLVVGGVSLCKLNGVRLCTLFGVSPRQQPRMSACEKSIHMDDPLDNH